MKNVSKYDKFINRLTLNNELYRNGLFKIVSPFRGFRSKILIEDKYGVCEVRADSIISGYKPSIRSAIDKNSYIINRFKEIHGDKYDYSKVEYVKRSEHVTITCPIHGDFDQKVANHLLGSSCPKCSITDNKIKRGKYDNKTFITKAKEVHGDKYDYSKVEYTNSYGKVVITCPIHGDFEKTASHHLQGSGCQKCSLENSRKSRFSNTKKFVKKSNKIHNGFYSYNNVEYVDNTTKVKIICPEHGEFEQRPSKHLRGHGCRVCQYQNTSFKLSDWRKMGGDNPGVFYILKCWNDNEEFYKVGITCNSIRKRYNSKNICLILMKL